MVVTFTERWILEPSSCPGHILCVWGTHLQHTWQVIEREPSGTKTAGLRVGETLETGAPAPQPSVDARLSPPWTNPSVQS